MINPVVNTIPNEGVVLSVFVLEPNEKYRFGLEVIRDNSKVNVPTKLKTVRVLTNGSARLVSSITDIEIDSKTPPPKIGSEYYTKLTAGPEGCGGVFMGFNDPRYTITNVGRRLFNTPSSESFDSDAVVALLSGGMIVNGVEVEPLKPFKVSIGDKIKTGMGTTDIIFIKYH